MGTILAQLRELSFGSMCLRIFLAMALGGKGLLMLVGPLSDVKTSTKAAGDEIRRRGLLVSEVVISNPSEELLTEYL